MFGLIRRTFRFLDENMFLPLYKTYVRSHLDFCSSVWAPYLDKHIEKIEQVQKRATRQIPGFRELTYPERLRKLKLPTLSYRRLRGDLIETYKILHNIYDPQTVKFLKLWDDATTRNSTYSGNSMKLYPRYSRLDLRKFSFSIRVVKHWNNLPDNVITAPSVNCFKNRLDKHYSDSPKMYDEYKREKNDGLNR